ncbi:unnamed protein product [Caenorhabditis brenneri]
MTKKSGGCFVLWICLAMITIPFYVFRAQSYIFHGKLGCSSVFHEANGLIENELNNTIRILKRPNYYSNISRSCQEADKCSHVIKNSAEHSGLTLSSLCPFFVFYTSDFSICGDRLANKIGQNVTCVDVIWRFGIETNDTSCQQWDLIHNCLLNEIETTCEDFSFNSTRITEYLTELEAGFCSKLGNSTWEMESEDVVVFEDTSDEILELSEA